MDAFGQISNPFVDPGPVAGGGSSLCPEGFEEFSGICYHFGSHASYVSASAKCQEFSAELVRVNDRNLDWIQSKVAETSGNDNWVGNSKVFGKETKRTAKTCPLLRGSGPDRKVIPSDCTSANPFICEYNRNRPPAGYGPPGGGYAPHGYPAPGGYAPAPGGYPAQPSYPQPYQPSYQPGYGAAPPPAAGVPPPPDYGSVPGTVDKSYDIPDTNPETTTKGIDVEPSEGGNSKKVVLPILIILLIIGAFLAYRYWKKNYASDSKVPPKQHVQHDPDKTQLNPATPTTSHEKSAWNDRGNTLPSNGPHSFENPMFQSEHFQSHSQSHEMAEATYNESSIEDQLPPGMTMEDPRDPETRTLSRRKSSRRDGSRYRDEPRQRDESEFEIPPGLPHQDWPSHRSNGHQIFDPMISPQSGGPPNSMTFQRDYRQQYHDNSKNHHSKIYEIEAFDDSFNQNLPDVVQHQRIQDIMEPEQNHEAFGRSQFADRGGPRRPSTGPTRPPPPERIRSVREDMMMARTMLPDAPKENGVQSRADAPSYRTAPPRPGEVSVKAVPSMADFRGNTQKDQLWAAAFHSLITGEKLPQSDVDQFHSMQPEPLNPRKMRDDGPNSLDSDDSGNTNCDVPRAYRPNEIEIIQPDSLGLERKVEELSSHKIRQLPDSGPKSIPVEVTSIPLGQQARMEQLTMRDLDSALKEFKIDNGENSTKVPEFKSIELKVPSLTKPADYDDGNIYDDLDSGSEMDLGARVAAPETTDMLRKSQIMNLKKQ